MMGFSYEKRPLKKTKLGPPDVYPQQPKQKEDELTEKSVTKGFSPPFQVPAIDEYGSGRSVHQEMNTAASKFSTYFNAILLLKEKSNTLAENVSQNRKRQQINTKENFWAVTARSKNAVDMWFKDLAASKPLTILQKKAPVFNKKEEMFVLLCEYQVPVIRATWFIKLSSAYTINVSEQKIKKRQSYDPTQDWTIFLLKFMKEQLTKLQDYYQNQNQSSALVSMVQAGGPSPADEYRLALKQWQYCVSLAKHMYQEGLLERQDVLVWILDLLERSKSSSVEDGTFRLLIASTLQYLHEFVQSEQLSRRLVHFCARKLSNLCSYAASQLQLENNSVNQSSTHSSTPQTPSPCTAPNQPSNNQNVSNSTANNQVNPASDPASVLFEYLKCSHHRDVVISLSTVIQVITLECPTALVWNNVGENKTFSLLSGSPLDILPCNPANLPTAQRCATSQIRQQLRLGEELIRQRSAAAMSRWSSDKWQQSSAGIKMQKILNTLDALDSHNFERIDQNNSIDTLYNNIFPPIPEKQVNANSSNMGANKLAKGAVPAANNVSEENKKDYDVWQDEAIVDILCDWAISNLRTGEHRAIAVAKLLEKRQTEILNPGSFSTPPMETETMDDRDESVCTPVPFPIFQPVLMNYLDHHAPVLDNNPENNIRFTNFVHLFSQLIRHDMFSHDAYMCTLISRGDLNSSGPTPNADNNISHSNNAKSMDTSRTSGPSSSYMHLDNDSGIFDTKPNTNQDCDDSKIDDDLDKILQHIKQEQQNSMDGPDSPKIEPPSSVSHPLHGMNSQYSRDNDHMFKSSRHVLFATHFPLPLDDESSCHDCNQRYMLLFGVGKQRDDARHTVKRISKDICKLFSKKFCIDVAEDGKVKKHSRSEFNFELITTRVQSLSYFDQHLVTYQCSTNLIEIINNFSSPGNSNYLPVQEHVAFLFDLMELSLNVDGLIDLCIMLLVEIPKVEKELDRRGSSLVKVYNSSLILYVLGVLRRYHTCLLMSKEQTVAVFEGLYRLVRNIPNPGECTSVERCIFSHLYDLYNSDTFLKTHVYDFVATYQRIRQSIYSKVAITPNLGQWNIQGITTFMSDVIMSYRRGARIDPNWLRPLHESQTNRYLLVCNVMITLCNESPDVDRLNDLGILCAELTAGCNALSAEWLGVLMALCCSSNHPSYFGDVLSNVDLQNQSIHNSLAIFTAILVARNCISLEDFLEQVALPSLVIVRNDGRREADADAEAGARLTCHLLLRLFKTNESPQPGLYSVGTSPHPMVNHNASVWCIKQSCDRHLLAAMHHKIGIEAFTAVLKAITFVGDATAVRPGILMKKSPSGYQTPNHSGKMSGELSISHILGTSDILSNSSDNILDLGGGNYSETTAPNLSEFAQYVLKEICNQEWVLDRCLLNPEKLCESLLDPMLTLKQAQRLLHMICYPEIAASSDNTSDHKTIINNIIQKLDQWTLRMSYLDMQLMYKRLENKAESSKQSENKAEMNKLSENRAELNMWLDMVAKAAINVFQLNKNETKTKPESIWLVAPLISKLSSAVQGRVLKVAGHVLENIHVSNSSSASSTSSSSNNNNSYRSSSKGTPQHHQQHSMQQQKSPVASSAPLIHHQPFLSLVLTCLKGQDDQREALLMSLHTQLSQFLTLSKEERMNASPNDFSGKGEDGLLLRFSLVGGMFDTIQRNSQLTTDWAVLLVQLITHSVIDNSNNSDLFSTVIDMLATLIHSTSVPDTQNEKGEENRRHNQNLLKKLKKEVGDKKSLSVAQVRQLLPLSKIPCEVIACESIGLITDTKGNKITGFDSLDKKHGLHVTEKQKVNMWDVLEGFKNPTPISWTWFRAVRIERKPMWYEENHRLLKYHTHALMKPSSYFLEPLPLPPEEMEPPMEKPMKGGPSGAPETPTSVDSPRGIKRGMKQTTAGQRRAKKPAKPMTPTGPMPPAMHPQVQGAQVPSQHMNFSPSGPSQAAQNQGNGNLYPCQPGSSNGPPQWGGYPQQGGHMPQQPAPPYYSHQMPPGVSNGGRFERPQFNQSKQALSNMLRARGNVPNNQFIGMQQQPNMPPHNIQVPQRQFMRQQLRPQQHNMQPPNQQSGSGPMFSNSGTNAGPGQQQMFGNMPQNMNQNYNNFSGQQPQQQSQMMAAVAAQQLPSGSSQTNLYQQQQMQQQQAGTAGGASFNMRQQEYQQQHQQQSQQQQTQQRVRPSYMQTPNVTMNTMNHQQPAPPYTRAPLSQNAMMPQQQQYQQQFRRQQYLLQHQQQQQQQQQHPQQQHGQPMSHMQRQLQSGGQQPSYSMQPPPYT